MNRSQKLAILATMDDKVLSQACMSVGIPCDAEDYAADERPDVDEQLESWNSRRVPFGAAHHKEPLWLPKNVLEGPKEKPQASVPSYMRTPGAAQAMADVGAGDSAGDYAAYAGGDEL